MSIKSEQGEDIELLAMVRARAKVLAREDREMKASLIQLRRAANLSQQDIADRLGVSQQAINKIERYDSDPKLSTLRRYANAVGALITHEVFSDFGQSVWLASKSSWEVGGNFAQQLPQHSIEIGIEPSQLNEWTKPTAKDFVLAG